MYVHAICYMFIVLFFFNNCMKKKNIITNPLSLVTLLPNIKGGKQKEWTPTPGHSVVTPGRRACTAISPLCLNESAE